MSDDGYYYDDPEYEDFADMLYDADAGPDLADDLAARATYSPIWQDDVAEELRDYFSDWEYYSEDYFDDDPALLRERDTTGTTKEVSKRGKKRKASDITSSPPAKRREMAALTACLQGTVWKRQSPEPPMTYRQGMVEPVALKLGEQIMRSAYGKRRGFGRGGPKRDESWANDLSLADMGLKTERSTSIHEPTTVEGLDDEDGMMSEAVDDDLEDEVGADGRMMSNGEHDVPDHSATESESKDERPRKRKKAPPNDGKHDLSLVGSNKNGRRELVNEVTTEATNGSGKQQSSGPQDRHEEVNGATKVNGTARKRKLSPSEVSATSSTASSRAKRIDSKKTTVPPKGVPITAASSRPSRKAKG